jgi:hypothetical protein
MVPNAVWSAETQMLKDRITLPGHEVFISRDVIIMEPEDVLAWFALGIIGALGLALKLSFETRALRAGHAALSDTVQRLDAQFQRLGPSPPASQLDTEPAVPSTSVSQSLTAAEPAIAPAPEGPEPVAIPTPAPARLGKGWEQALAENWLVWHCQVEAL